MRFRSSSSAALMGALLVNESIAASVPHYRHAALHAKRVQVDVTETITITDYVTVEWPPASSAPPAAILAATTTTSSTTTATSTSTVVTPSSSPIVAVAAVPVSSSSSSSTTLATVAVTHAALAAAVVPSSSTAAVATTAATSSGKRGAAYNVASLVTPFSGSQVTWAYNWGSNSDGLTGPFEYVPMLWGLGDQVDGWSSAASSAIASGSSHLLSFNEPDLPAQSDLSVGAAAAGFQTYMMPFAGKAKLGAPAVTNGAAPMGLAWLSDFLSACTGCQIDFVAIHWYDSASNAAYFKQHVHDTYTAGGGKPVWITEFGASGSTDEINSFLQEVIPWLDSQSYVERYAYFMCSDGVLLNGNSLSELGQTFADYT